MKASLASSLSTDALAVPVLAALPTPQTYAELQWAYDHFNRSLFASQLPP